MAFRPPEVSTSWPSKALQWNLALRLTGGIRELYAQVATSRALGDTTPASRGEHETLSSGQLHLAVEMPMLAQRYRFQHVLSQSPLSQVVCAIDTFRNCHVTVDGRCQPLVAIKILNAQHWLLGAQEYERMRQLVRQQQRKCVDARLVLPIGHFELGAHFCIVLPMLCELSRLPHARPPADAQLSSGIAASAPGALSSAYRRKLPSAQERAAARPRLELGALRRVGTQLLGALLLLHESGVMHADLKPENIMAEGAESSERLSELSVRLIDFSNAMTETEAVAYHDLFEVQTIGYPRTTVWAAARRPLRFLQVRRRD